MLVVKRKTNQRVRIGDDIWITIVEVCGRNEVRLGVDAPPEIRVLREELIDDERLPQRHSAASDAGR